MKYDFINLVIADKLLDQFLFDYYMEDGEIGEVLPFFECYELPLDKETFHHYLHVNWEYKIMFLKDLIYYE